jgi:hypothetical protein
MVNFVLHHLNDDLSMNVQGSLDASAVALIDGSACAVFQVKLDDMKAVFKYQTDSFDISNADASDIKYYVYSNAWPVGINVAHAMMQGTDASGAANAMSVEGGSYDDDRNLLKHDFVRYLAKRLFNTIHGVDLFQNEHQLLENIVLHGNTIKGNITTKLAAVDVSGSHASIVGDNGSKYLTNATTGDENICRSIMRQLAAVSPQRFVDVSGVTTIQPVPFAVNDSLYFKVTVKSDPNQHSLTGVSAIENRVYNIRLLIAATATTSNTVVTDSTSHRPNYPYGPA